MIEINFAEKKKVDMSPYLIIAISLLLIAAGLITLLLYQSSMDKRFEQLEQKKLTNDAVIAELDQFIVTKQQIQTLENQIEQLDASIFPSLYLLDNIQSNTPEGTYIANYQFSITDGVTVILQGTTMEQAAQFSNNLNQERFVDNLQLLQLEKLNNGYVATFSFQTLKDYLLEEADTR
ncbi:hypothetical protein F9U64_09250 [Gracilibacillus oryzae]|uniref:Fimbrial assembly protein n=1 Tax=Gracilibacillus oryzae TaxID=1672701 RepID=A0A7C8KSC1_9BACI|nr:PilN domain-containing protein [Gracilibacillus oryzae]KAB8137499.1 hypothetical protein F9U64_09250 [Gracilibacillus oryzae]